MAVRRLIGFLRRTRLRIEHRATIGKGFGDGARPEQHNKKKEEAYHGREKLHFLRAGEAESCRN